MERTANNINDFKQKAYNCIVEAARALSKIDTLCTEEGYDSNTGEYMGWFNDYLLPPYDGKKDAYPFGMDLLEQISAIYKWADSIIDSISEKGEQNEKAL